MVRKILSFGFRVVVGGLAAAGLVALLLAGLIATPLHHPPELPSISEARKFVDLSNLQVLQRYGGSDGTALAYRHYRPVQASTDRIAIVVHGSSGSSGGTIHALSSALMERGVQTYAVDVRGHGASGTRGDIGYVGQLEDDLANLVAVVRQDNPTAPLTLIGHSSGGGFSIARFCSRPIWVTMHRPTSRTAAGRARTFRGSSDCWRLPSSESPAATTCRWWPSRCRPVPRTGWWQPTAKDCAAISAPILTSAPIWLPSADRSLCFPAVLTN
jgi:hypothetical protein